MRSNDWLKLFVSLLGPTAAGAIGSLFTFQAIPTWYTTLEKPALNPPNWVFGPVWTTLYILMGIAAFLVWKRGWDQPQVRKALYIFIVQLLLNALWSMLFFGLRSPGIAFVEIVMLWISIVVMIVSFGSISRAAAWLLVPYLLWVSFASYLNFSIWMLN